MPTFPMLLVRTDKPARRRLYPNSPEGRLQAVQASPPGSRLTPCRFPASGEGAWVAGYDPAGVVLDVDARV